MRGRAPEKERAGDPARVHSQFLHLTARSGKPLLLFVAFVLGVPSPFIVRCPRPFTLASLLTATTFQNPTAVSKTPAIFLPLLLPCFPQLTTANSAREYRTQSSSLPAALITFWSIPAFLARDRQVAFSTSPLIRHSSPQAHPESQKHSSKTPLPISVLRRADPEIETTAAHLSSLLASSPFAISAALSFS